MRRQFHIVHDDEALQVSQQLFVLIGGNLQLERIALAPNVQIALNAPLRVSTRFHAPPLAARSFTVLVTMPLSQRKRSSPRTATRRSQPRSWTAAPEASAAISFSGASNCLGVSAPR